MVTTTPTTTLVWLMLVMTMEAITYPKIEPMISPMISPLILALILLLIPPSILLHLHSTRKDAMCHHSLFRNPPLSAFPTSVLNPLVVSRCPSNLHLLVVMALSSLPVDKDQPNPAAVRGQSSLLARVRSIRCCTPATQGTNTNLKMQHQPLNTLISVTSSLISVTSSPGLQGSAHTPALPNQAAMKVQMKINHYIPGKQPCSYPKRLFGKTQATSLVRHLVHAYGHAGQNLRL